MGQWKYIWVVKVNPILICSFHDEYWSCSERHCKSEFIFTFPKITQLLSCHDVNITQSPRQLWKSKRFINKSVPDLHTYFLRVILSIILSQNFGIKAILHHWWIHSQVERFGPSILYWDENSERFVQIPNDVIANLRRPNHIWQQKCLQCTNWIWLNAIKMLSTYLTLGITNRAIVLIKIKLKWFINWKIKKYCLDSWSMNMKIKFILLMMLERDPFKLCYSYIQRQNKSQKWMWCTFFSWSHWE